MISRLSSVPAQLRCPSFRDLRVAATDASGLVAAGFSLRKTARDLKVAPTDASGLVAAGFSLR